MITGQRQEIIDKSLFEASIESRVSKIPSIIIEPSKRWLNLDLLSIWNYRELLYFLALRDIQIRYKQTLIGIVWVLLQPILTTIVFSVLFSSIGQGTAQDIPYPLFAFSGFTIWTFFNAAIFNSSNSLINHTGLITKVFFPRLIIPISAVGAILLDLFFGLLSLLVVMLIYHAKPNWTVVFAPFFLFIILLLALGLGILLSAVSVRYRDVKYILPFALQLWLFVSPVFYSLKVLPEKAVWLWKLNPIAGALDGFRAALFGQEFDAYGIIASIVISVIIFLFAVYVFHRMEDGFADVI